MADVFLYASITVAAILVGRLVLVAFWRALGAYRIRRAGPRPLNASRHRLWREPGPVQALDPVNGPGGPDGAPVPPFRFIEEHFTGSQVCVSVQDGRERRWRIKWGEEARSETFAVLLAWSCGYFAEVTYFVPSGTIQGAANLRRAQQCISPDDGAFHDARFELSASGATDDEAARFARALTERIRQLGEVIRPVA